MLGKLSVPLACSIASLLVSTLTLFSAAPEPVDPQRIEQLVGQLGSQRFAEREAAMKELDAIGAPALEALKKAAKSEEAEQRRRAEELVTKIERRILTATLLAPTKVHLNCKDTPVPEAVAELAKKTGNSNALVVSDPQGKLQRPQDHV